MVFKKFERNVRNAVKKGARDVAKTTKKAKKDARNAVKKGARDVAKTTKKAKKDARNAVKKGARDVAKTAKKAEKDARNAVKKGARDVAKTAEKAVQDTGKTIEKATHDVGKTAEKAAHDTGRTLEKAGHDIGGFWDKNIKPIGQYAEENPIEAAVILACISYGGFLLASGKATVTINAIVPTASGNAVVPIATVSSSTAGGASLAAGGAGILNALSNDEFDPDESEQIRQAVQEFKKEVQSTNKSLDEVIQVYARHFDVATYGRKPLSRVYLLEYPEDAVSADPQQEMAEILIASPIATGGEVLHTGDFFNLRSPSRNHGVEGEDVRRIHAAYDITSKSGQSVYAPMTGKVVRVNYPYGQESHPKSGQMLGLTIQAHNGVQATVFYVQPLAQILEKIRGNKPFEVHAGSTEIGKAQNIRLFYEERGSKSPPKNHVHLHFADDEGRRLSILGSDVVKD